MDVGTGVIVGAGEIVTAAHVVGNRKEVLVHVGGRQLSVEVAALDREADLALLLVAGSETTSALSLAPTLPLVGEDVVVFGAADGTVAATRGIVSAYETIAGVQHLRTDAAVNRGSSGGPVIDRSGDVIGVVVTKVEGRDGIAHAVTAPVLAEFLKDRPAPSFTTATPTGAIPPWALIGGFAGVVALAGLGRRAASRRREAGTDVRLGRSRIRLAVDATTPTDTGDNDGS